MSFQPHLGRHLQSVFCRGKKYLVNMPILLPHYMCTLWVSGAYFLLKFKSAFFKSSGSFFIWNLRVIVDLNLKNFFFNWIDCAGFIKFALISWSSWLNLSLRSLIAKMIFSWEQSFSFSGIQSLHVFMCSCEQESTWVDEMLFMLFLNSWLRDK